MTTEAERAVPTTEARSTRSVWLERARIAAMVLAVAIALVAMEVLGLLFLELLR